MPRETKAARLAREAAEKVARDAEERISERAAFRWTEEVPEPDVPPPQSAFELTRGWSVIAHGIEGRAVVAH